MIRYLPSEKKSVVKHNVQNIVEVWAEVVFIVIVIIIIIISIQCLQTSSCIIDENDVSMMIMVVAMFVEIV